MIAFAGIVSGPIFNEPPTVRFSLTYKRLFTLKSPSIKTGSIVFTNKRVRLS